MRAPREAADAPHADDGFSVVGRSPARKEDARHLHGLGRFIADLAMPGMRHVAFVRSPLAHARLRAIALPDLREGESAWTAADLAPVARPIVAELTREGFQRAPYPALATDVVRFVGQPVAAVVAATAARAEDLAEQVELDLDPLPVVADARAALAPDAPRLHDGWHGNWFMRTGRTLGDVDAAAARADVHVTRRYRMGRVAPAPLETRGCLAHWDRGRRRLAFHTATQRPHIQRDFLAELLIGLDARDIQVITPDVGGAFGVKTNLYPEELAVAAIALRVPYPLRWIEDRMEHLLSACQAREHEQTVTLHATRDGEIVAVEADFLVDGGAYSMLPSTSAIEGNMAANVLPGPYRILAYRYSTVSACTNKPPTGPYRGVGRPAACFAIERTIDELARELGLEAHELRRRNLIGREAFPWTTVTGLRYDSGDYAPMLEAAVRAIGHDAIRARQRATPPDATERIGVGYAWYVEQTAHGAAEFRARGSVVLYGFESARVKLDLSGTLTVETSVQSHGQGHETTLAQIAAEVTTIPYERIAVRAGDTDLVPYGNGTFASRSVVLAGGATAQACRRLRAKLLAIGAHLLGATPDAVRLEEGAVVGAGGRVPLARLARVALQDVHDLPPGLEPGLECMASYRPPVETGTFSAGVHAAAVSVDVDTGAVRVLDYLVVEDCGRAIHPVIVSGQTCGGVAQGIGQALFEEVLHDASGQPATVTLADYLLPGFAEVPDVRVEHRQTLSAFTEFGMKGTGEGGCIGGPAAIGNAVSDALGGRVRVTRTPIVPADVWRALQRARAGDPASTWEPEA